jgi:HlyD family type I secretion membrane fusion protein
LVETRRDSALLAEKVAAIRDTYARLSIRAPVAGTVVDLAVTTVGGVVQAGDRIMEIVPDGDQLIVEARLDPRYVDRVRAGLSADLHFDAYMNLAMRPLATGQVKTVSADAMMDDRTGTPYYVLRVAIPPTERRRLGDVKLQPGMLCSVMVKTGEQTLLAYLTRPIVRRFFGTFSES